MSEDSAEAKGNGKLSDSQLKRARAMIDRFSGVPKTRRGEVDTGSHNIYSPLIKSKITP